MMAKDSLTGFYEAIENGQVDNIEEFGKALEKINEAYDKDEWAWVKAAYKDVFDVELSEAQKEQVAQAGQALLKVKGKFLNLVIADAEKEFAELSRCGFGLEGSAQDAQEDFETVRGTIEGNKFVKDMRKNITQLQERIKRLQEELSNM